MAAYAHQTPFKRAKPSVKSFVNYTPAQKYVPRPDTDTFLSYPLTLYPRATIQIYRNRGPTPLKAPCRQCVKLTTVSLAQQKLFLTAERLLRKPMDKVADIERNQTNTWAVNYDVGIYEPFVENNTGFKSKMILENRFYPFVDEFELEVVVKLLQRIGEGLGERSLNLYLKMLKGMDELARTIHLARAPVVTQQHLPHVPVPAFVPAFETPKKQKSYQYIPISPPVSSPPRPPQYYSQYPSFSSSPPGPAPPAIYRPPQASTQLPSLPRILDNKPPLRSFNDLKGLFEVFDKIERGSYAAARLMEAYADVIVNEACIDCWARHNIVNDDEGDDAGFVDLFPFPPVVQEQSHLPQGVQVFIDPYTGVPINIQQNYELPGLQGGMGVTSRPPFEELGNNVRSSLERTRRSGEEENKLEDELERRWKERTRKREAAKKPKKWGEGERDVVFID